MQTKCTTLTPVTPPPTRPKLWLLCGASLQVKKKQRFLRTDDVLIERSSEMVIGCFHVMVHSTRDMRLHTFTRTHINE